MPSPILQDTRQKSRSELYPLTKRANALAKPHHLVRARFVKPRSRYDREVVSEWQSDHRLTRKRRHRSRLPAFKSTERLLLEIYGARLRQELQIALRGGVSRLLLEVEIYNEADSASEKFAIKRVYANLPYYAGYRLLAGDANYVYPVGPTFATREEAHAELARPHLKRGAVLDLGGVDADGEWDGIELLEYAAFRY